MQLIDKERKKKVFEEFNQRHGSMVKLLSENGEVVGYFSRCEMGQDQDIIDVVINISFSVNYFIDMYKVGQDQNDIKFKFLNNSEIKTFSLCHLLKLKKENLSYDNPCFYLKYDEENFEDFKIGLIAIINTQLVWLQDDIFLIRERKYRFDNYEWAVNKMLKMYESINYDNLKKYLFNNALNVLKYYKKKKINLFFI